MRSVSATTASVPSRRIWTGPSALYCFTVSAIRRKWARPRSAAFLTHLAVDRNVAASTQNQALNALVFVYKVVLQCPLGDIVGAVRAKKPQKLPVVLTQAEVKQVLSALNGYHWMACCLLYGSGLRLMECIRLRVQDLDFDHRAVIVRDGKGRKDRVVTLPDALTLPLQRHLGAVRNVHEKDLGDGFGAVYLPYALARKYPNAPKEWGWQYVFPAGRSKYRSTVGRGEAPPYRRDQSAKGGKKGG